MGMERQKLAVRASVCEINGVHTAVFQKAFKGVVSPAMIGIYKENVALQAMENSGIHYRLFRAVMLMMRFVRLKKHWKNDGTDTHCPIEHIIRLNTLLKVKGFITGLVVPPA